MKLQILLKNNAHVERAQRTHTEEFYETRLDSLEIEAARQELRDWERIYNKVRPHQSLNYQTPSQFLESLSQAS